MRDTPSLAGRHLPGPGWSSGWSHRWLSWSCGGYFYVLLATLTFLLLWIFQLLYVKIIVVKKSQRPRSYGVLGGEKIILVGASELLWAFLLGPAK